MKSGQDKGKGIFSWHLVIWPALTWAIIGGLCYWLDKLDPAVTVKLTGEYYVSVLVPGNPLEWAPAAWFFIAIGILYIVSIWLIYRHAKRYNRNAVRWTTAAIVFSPVLAWIVYGLSWRKNP
jgi:hypothetical protein